MKLAFDKALLGNSSDDQELQESLEDFDLHWHFGGDGEEAWNEAVRTSTENLFSILYDSSKVSSISGSVVLFRLYGFLWFNYCR